MPPITHRELIHVDDVYDEMRDKELMRQASAEEEALRKMHQEKIIRAENMLKHIKDIQKTLNNVVPDGNHENSKAAVFSASFPKNTMTQNFPTIMEEPNEFEIDTKNSIVIDPREYIFSRLI